jgi:hypothetical protein
MGRRKIRQLDAPSYANGLNLLLHLGFSKRGERNSGQTARA